MNNDNYNDKNEQRYSSSYPPFTDDTSDYIRTGRDIDTEGGDLSHITERPNTETGSSTTSREELFTRANLFLHPENTTYDHVETEDEAESQLEGISAHYTPQPRVYKNTSYEELLDIINTSKQSAKRAAAVRTLGHFDTRDSKRVLIFALMDTNAVVRAAALEVCMMLPHRLPVAIVEAAMTDSNIFVRATAMLAFSYFGDNAPIKRIAAVADDEEESIQVRYWALYTLGELQDKNSAYRFLQLLNNDNTNEELREVAAVALGRIGPLDKMLSDLAITVLRARVRSTSETVAVRVASAHALAQRRQPLDDQTLSILRAALMDKDKSVRQAVDIALNTIVKQLVSDLQRPVKSGTTYTAMINILYKLVDRVHERTFEALLEHSDVAVRQAALQILNTPDKELPPSNHFSGFMPDKHIQHHIKLSSIKGKQLGTGYVYLLTPADLKETVLPQAFTQPWLPDSLLRLITVTGAEKKFSYTDISPYLYKQFRTEYIRSLLHSRSVVIPIAQLYSIPTLFNDFLPQRASHDAFKWLLSTGAIIPLLTTETQPDQASAFVPSTNGFAAWQRICYEVRMLCVRFSWEKGRYQSIEQHHLQELQKSMTRIASTLASLQQGKNTSSSEATAIATSIQTIIDEGQITTRTHLLEKLYEHFLLVEGSRSREHFYDGTKPQVTKVKQVLDASYTKNLANALQSHSFTPGDTPTLAMLPIHATRQTPNSKGQTLVPHIIHLVQLGLFPNVRPGRYLKSLRQLQLQDVVEFRSSQIWDDYIEEVQQLYKSTFYDIRHHILALHQKYTDLAASITALFDGRVPQHQQTEIYSEWTPIPTLQLNIGEAILAIRWSGDDVFYNFSTQEPQIDVKGSAAFSMQFSIGEWQNGCPTHDLAIGFNFMHGTIDDAKTTWEALKKHLHDHLEAAHLKQLEPIQTGPMLG